MKESRKLLLGSIVALGLVIGLIVVTSDAQNVSNEETRRYKSLVGNFDDSIRKLRLGGNPASALNGVRTKYSGLVSGENFDNGSYLYNLNAQIKDTFNSLIFGGGGGVSLDNLRALKGKVSTMASQLGIGLPFAYSHPALVVLLFSISLGFLGTYLCKRLIRWEKLKSAKRNLEEWRRKMRKAKRKKGKKKRKSELKGEEIRDEQRKLWTISIKQAIFYLALFAVFFAWIGYVFGNWTVAWLPFDSLSSLTGISLDYFGWFLLTYFGFAYIWRVVLLPER